MPFPTKSPSMPPPGMPEPKPAAAITADKKPGMGDEPEDSGKDAKKLEGAGVYRADQRCQNCENWQPETGDCEELPGTFDAMDGCLAYFEPVGDSSDPDEASEGELEGSMPPPEAAEAQA